jgi:hypothetical protein
MFSHDNLLEFNYGFISPLVFYDFIINRCWIIVIYYTSGLNECLMSDAFNKASGEAASALTLQVKH